MQILSWQHWFAVVFLPFIFFFVLLSFVVVLPFTLMQEERRVWRQATLDGAAGSTLWQCEVKASISFPLEISDTT